MSSQAERAAAGRLCALVYKQATAQSFTLSCQRPITSLRCPYLPVTRRFLNDISAREIVLTSARGELLDPTGPAYCGRFADTLTGRDGILRRQKADHSPTTDKDADSISFHSGGRD